MILRGARQVGKSTIARELGKSYENYIELNLERGKDASFFTIYGDDVKVIFDAIAFENNIELKAGETLLFIDEIQEQPNAITLLRYFYEDLPELDVIAAGSLLEFVLNEIPSYPVGRVEQIPVHPLDFEEFLMALGETKALAELKKVPISSFAHQKLEQLFRNYILVGGMPEVVDEYVKNGRQVTGLTRVYSSIWDNYRDDIEKYGSTNNEKRLLNHIFDTAPYVRDRITFNGFGSSSYSSREVSEAFRKLHKAGIVKLIYPTVDLQAPVTANLKRKPKIQFLDTGLLNYAGNIHQELLELKDFNDIYRGYVVNHMIFQELIAQSIRLHEVPFFWTRESTNANAEVDVVLPFGALLIPLEIKSGAKGSLKSLHEFMSRVNHTLAFRLLSNEFSREQSHTKTGKPFTLTNLPLYCISNIRNWIEYVKNLDSEKSE